MGHFVNFFKKKTRNQILIFQKIDQLHLFLNVGLIFH